MEFKALSFNTLMCLPAEETSEARASPGLWIPVAKSQTSMALSAPLVRESAINVALGSRRSAWHCDYRRGPCLHESGISVGRTLVWVSEELSLSSSHVTYKGKVT